MKLSCVQSVNKSEEEAGGLEEFDITNLELFFIILCCNFLSIDLSFKSSQEEGRKPRLLLCYVFLIDIRSRAEVRRGN
jgi:hypothetical protein